MGTKVKLRECVESLERTTEVQNEPYEKILINHNACTCEILHLKDKINLISLYVSWFFFYMHHFSFIGTSLTLLFFLTVSLFPLKAITKELLRV